jgi:DNA-binding winged helix-turn-helix (wHTH) protein/tetratricopeptide (TPR) repeat protein
LVLVDQRALYEFGRFRVDPGQEVLLRDGEPVALPPKAFETLRMLVERRGSIVSKRDLLAAVWPGVFVEENNLSQCVSLLRKTLGDDPREPVYIQTVARRGYRFCAALESLAVPAEAVEARRAKGWWGFVSRPRTSVIAIAGVGLAAALGLASGAARSPLVSAAANPVSIAVLPYRIADHEQAESFAGLALADDLIRQLSGRSASLRVQPVSAVYSYVPADAHDVANGSEPGAEAGVGPVQAARRLGVDLVVVVRVEYKGDGALLRASLLRAKDGVAVWTQSFRGDREHPFALQDQLVKALQTVLLGEDGGTMQRAHITANLRAYGAYVQGRMLWNQRTSEGVYRSIDREEQATAEDPKFAVAYAALADAYAFDITGWHKAEQTARKALALDAGLGEAHASLGLVHMLWQGDYEAAAAEFRMAIRLNPGYAGAHEWYADNFATQARMTEAFHEMQSAMELDATSLPVNTDMARLYYLSHRFDRARDQSWHALELDPKFLGAHVVLHDTLIQRHEYDAAMAEFRTIEEIAGTTGLYSSTQAKTVSEAYARAGIRGFYAVRADYFSTEFKDNYLRAKYLALLGRKEDSVVWLRRALNDAGPNKLFVLYASTEPAFDGIRDDPRFKKLMGAG